jgi:hypothetical protein
MEKESRPDGGGASDLAAARVPNVLTAAEFDDSAAKSRPVVALSITVVSSRLMKPGAENELLLECVSH